MRLVASLVAEQHAGSKSMRDLTRQCCIAYAPPLTQHSQHGLRIRPYTGGELSPGRAQEADGREQLQRAIQQLQHRGPGSLQGHIEQPVGGKTGRLLADGEEAGTLDVPACCHSTTDNTTRASSTTTQQASNMLPPAKKPPSASPT